MKLFVEILVRLTYERTGRVAYAPREKAEVHQAAHDAIAQAVLAGDSALAQRRMREHLAAITTVDRRQARQQSQDTMIA
jgi:DNA-binding FadR family transcriptional regulator